MSIGCAHGGSLDGMKRKVYKKTSVNIAKGINAIGTIDIDVSRIVSIDGVVNYKTGGYILPLSYPMLNYGSGGYIEWGLAPLIKGKQLQVISGEVWQNCDVKIVITYI